MGGALFGFHPSSRDAEPETQMLTSSPTSPYIPMSLPILTYPFRASPVFANLSIGTQAAFVDEYQDQFEDSAHNVAA